MAGSTFYGSTSNQYIAPKIVWSSTTNVEGNYSTVTATLYVSRSNTGYTTSGTWSGGITISGSTATATKSVSITYNSNTMMVSHTANIGHNSDGSQTVTISAYGGISGTSYTSTSIGGTFNLDTIPRASLFTLSASEVIIGNNLTINIQRASKSFSHVVYLQFGDLVTIATGVGDSYTWNTGNKSDTFFKYLTSATSTYGYIIVETYTSSAGGTLIGSKSMACRFTLGSNVVPKLNSINLPVSTITINGVGVGHVQGKSSISASILASRADGDNYSSITSYVSSLNGITYRGSSFSTGTLTKVGTNTITSTVTDSRGRTASKTENFEVIAYSNPVITSFSVQRCTENGVLNNEGTYVKVITTGSISSINTKNTKNCKLKYRAKGATTWTEVIIPMNDYTLNYSATVGSGNFSINSSYDFQIDLTDYYTTSSMGISIGTATPTMDFKSGGKGIAFGKVAEMDNTLEIAWPILHSGALNKGGWNAPTKGALTQVIDNSNAQHSVIVGVDASNKRYYGIDLLDSITSPVLRLYSGGKYLGLRGDGNHDLDGNFAVGGKITTGGYEIAESGVNANGRYVKFYNGIAIAYKGIYYGDMDFSALAVNNIYYSNTFLAKDYINFPITFYEVPETFVNIASTGYMGCMVTNNYIDKFRARLWAYYSGTQNSITLSYMAVGRWKA